MGSLVNGTTPAMKCPATVVMMKATSNGVFEGESPLDFALPLLILQICLVVAVTRSLAFLLRPMRQPRVVAEIIVSPRYLTGLDQFLTIYGLANTSTRLKMDLYIITASPPHFRPTFIFTFKLYSREKSFLTHFYFYK